MSALDWWALAGVDVLAEERPRDWLAPVRPMGGTALALPGETSPGAEAGEAVPPPPAIDTTADSLPATLDAFAGWWLADAALPGAPAQRVPPAGPAGAAIMILLEMPDQADAAARALLTGEAAALFDRMLAAIGRDRAGVYLAALWPARPAGGIADKARTAALAAIARHHVALVAPKRLLMVGRAAEALTGQDVARARGVLHDIGGVPAVATAHPATIGNRAGTKAAAWADLLLLTKDLSA